MTPILHAVAVISLAACRLPDAVGARPLQPGELAASWLRAAPTPVILQQRESDCGLAALAMVAGSWGHTWSVADLTRRLEPTPRGIRLGALRDLARELGLDAYAIEASPDDLRHELAVGRPVVVGLILPDAGGRDRHHYEVVVAMDPDGGMVVTIDPASGQWLRRSSAVLDGEWRAAGYPALVVVGEQVSSPLPRRAIP